MALMQITIPAGVRAGGKMQVRTPAGQLVEVVVPPGMTAGQALRIEVPDVPKPPPVASSAPPPPRWSAAAENKRSPPQPKKNSTSVAGRNQQGRQAPGAAPSAAAKQNAKSGANDARRDFEEGAAQRAGQRAAEREAEDAAAAARIAERAESVRARAMMRAEVEAMQRRHAELRSRGGKLSSIGPGALLSELEEHATSNKKVAAIREFVATMTNVHGGRHLLGEAEVISVLQRMPYYLRWPDALAALQPRMQPETSAWAERAIQVMTDPRA